MATKDTSKNESTHTTRCDICGDGINYGEYTICHDPKWFGNIWGGDTHQVIHNICESCLLVMDDEFKFPGTMNFTGELEIDGKIHNVSRTICSKCFEKISEYHYYCCGYASCGFGTWNHKCKKI